MLKISITTEFIRVSSDTCFSPIFSYISQYPQAGRRVFENQTQTKPVHTPVHMLPLISANTGATSYAPPYEPAPNEHQQALLLISTGETQRAAGNGSSGCSAPDSKRQSPYRGTATPHPYRYRSTDAPLSGVGVLGALPLTFPFGVGRLAAANHADCG